MQKDGLGDGMGLDQGAGSLPPLGLPAVESFNKMAEACAIVRASLGACNRDISNTVVIVSVERFEIATSLLDSLEKVFQSLSAASARSRRAGL